MQALFDDPGFSIMATGFLVGATPRNQQLGEIIGVVTAAIAMSTVLALFRDQIVSGEFKAPQANLIRLVIDGVLDGGLPWALVFAGAFMALCVEMMGLPTLAFAVGLYLPMHLAVPIMMGGLVRLFVEKRFTGEGRSDRRETGVLFSSGLIAGAALVGVVGAALTFFFTPEAGEEPRGWFLRRFLSDGPPASEWFWAIAALLVLAGLLTRKVTLRAK